MGNCSQKREKKNRRWEEHFEDLLNFNDDTEARVTPVNLGGRVPRMDRGNETSVTKVEVEVALIKIRSGRDGGWDGIPAECLKQGGWAIVE